MSSDVHTVWYGISSNYSLANASENVSLFVYRLPTHTHNMLVFNYIFSASSFSVPINMSETH